MRRGGKTFRMVEEAVRVAGSGHVVYIVVLNERCFHGIINMVAQLTPCHVVAHDRIRLQSGEIRLIARNAEDLARQLAGTGSKVYVDHAVYDYQGVSDHALDALHYGMSCTEVYTDFEWRVETHHIDLADMYESEPKPIREARFNALRAEGKTLGEINQILDAEGFDEVYGAGLLPCPTKQHEIIRENKGARKLIAALEAD